MDNNELQFLRTKLKNGEYDGADIMHAWLAIDELLKARTPLTAQGLDNLIEAHVGGAELADGEYSAMVLFAAAVERAHGIGA